jgi:hypothetical protein
MRSVQRLLSLSFALLFTAAAPCLGKRPSPPDAAATCTRQLKAIGRALSAYQQARGELPAHLSELYPRYLADRGLVHCPADPSTGAPDFKGAAADPKLSCSYSYEMTTDSTAVHCLLLGPRPASMTWRVQKQAQQAYFGDRVPALRCGHHAGTSGGAARGSFLNLTLSSQVYRSGSRWELEAETLPSLLACLERDLDQGAETFRRRWEPGQLAEYLRTVESNPACRTRGRTVAGKLAAMAWASPFRLAYQLSTAVEGLYRAAGDTPNALLWRRRWTRSLLAPISA